MAPAAITSTVHGNDLVSEGSVEELELKCERMQAEAQRSVGSMRGLSLSLVDRLREVEATAKAAEEKRHALEMGVRRLRAAVSAAADMAKPVHAEDGPVRSAVTLTEVRTALLDAVKLADEIAK